jgi:membrane protease YdiL (CAAX protease family)
MVAAILCASIQVLEATLKSAQWKINNHVGIPLIWDMFFWDAISVLTEELIFRGALLYILIKKLGTSKGVLLSSIAFGIYHWFSFGIFGNIIPMFFVFIGTGMMGYAFALAFSRTESIALPIGLHLGWNVTFNTIFSNGPLGKGILLLESDQILSDWFSLVGLWLAPILLILFVSYCIPKRNREFT